MQSFVLDPAVNPYNVLTPGQRPRATLSPSMALRDGQPFLSFAVQGGDAQDQNLLQFFLNMVEFKMDVQQAVEAANVNSYQMQNSFGDHTAEPGRLIVRNDTPAWVQVRARGHGLSHRRVGAHLGARSTPFSSIAPTARCGAARATSAKTTASPGSAAAIPAIPPL